MGGRVLSLDQGQQECSVGGIVTGLLLAVVTTVQHTIQKSLTFADKASAGFRAGSSRSATRPQARRSRPHSHQCHLHQCHHQRSFNERLLRCDNNATE